MPTISQAMHANRRALSINEISLVALLEREYQITWNQISLELTRLKDFIRTKDAPTYQWLVKQREFIQAMRTIDRLFNQYTQQLTRSTVASQQYGSQLSQEMYGVTSGQLSSRGVLPPDYAIQFSDFFELVTALNPRSPIRGILDKYAKRLLDRVKKAIQESLNGPSPLADFDALMRKAASPGVVKAGAQTIIRTEGWRVFDQGLQLVWKPLEQRGQIIGYRWISRLSTQTCAACLARHNEVYPYYPGFRHINCRCVVIPVFSTEIFEPTFSSMSGEDWLRRQPEHIQRRILGSEAAFQEFKSGRSLISFTGIIKDPVWGEALVVKPM